MIDVLYWAARVFLFLGTVVLAGGLLFLLFAWPDGVRSRRVLRLLRYALVMTAVSTLALFGLYGPFVSGRGLSALEGGDLIGSVINSQFGLLTGTRLIVLLTLFWLLRFGLRKPVEDRPTVMFTALYVVVLLGTVSFGGHAGTGTTVTMVSHTMHLMAAATWLGGLVMLHRAILPHVAPHHVVRILPRYSTIATASVVVLVVSGSYQAYVEVGSVVRVFAGQWGGLLAAKVVVVASMLAMGYFSRRVTLIHLRSAKESPQGFSRSEEHAFRRKLRSSVTREIVAGLVVLAITAWLVGANPPSYQGANVETVSAEIAAPN